MTKKSTPATDQPSVAGKEAVRKSRRLTVVTEPGVSQDEAMANLAAAGLVANAGLVARFNEAEYGEMSLDDLVASLRKSGEAVTGGDLRSAEQMLCAQAVSLNAIFAELARRAALNMGTYLESTDRYMRLALKAQGQCRSTLETLAAIKNPPVVYARQANIANGPQQVNNLAAPSGPSTSQDHAHGETENQPTKLLGALDHEAFSMDTRTPKETGRTDSRLEAVAEVHRPANKSGQEAVRNEPLPRRHAKSNARTRR